MRTFGRKPEKIQPRYLVPKNAELKTCRICGSPIYWGRTCKGKNIPVDPDGRPHAQDCRKLARQKKNMQGPCA